MVDLFSRLKKSRETKGMTLLEISKVLRISENYLDAIEKKDYSRLPEKVYSIGFIRNYANYLDVDPNGLIKQFIEEIGDADAAFGNAETLPPIHKIREMLEIAKRWLGCKHPVVEIMIGLFILLLISLLICF
ncbi:MAG: helix-turn-helix domain-containing protein [Holosporaceae bacterium]|jgi:cytoskeletal protein RodZ|nr:helix-turn-helix domain-containing protein [Holosporaceae bacterium]